MPCCQPSAARVMGAAFLAATAVVAAGAAVVAGAEPGLIRPGIAPAHRGGR